MVKLKNIEAECLKEYATLHMKAEKTSHMHFPYTGKNKVRTEKRRRGFWGKNVTNKKKRK